MKDKNIHESLKNFLINLSIEKYHESYQIYKNLDTNSYPLLTSKILETRLTFYFERFLKKYNLSHSSTDFINILKSRNSYIGKKNLETLKTGVRISKILSGNNIKHVFLKGFALLILRKYEDIKERELRDVDLLINKEDAQKVNKILQENGFKILNNNGLNYDITLDDNKYCLPSYVNDDGILIEVHYGLGISKPQTSYKLSNQILKNSILISTGENSLSVPRDEDLLLHHLYHSITKEYFNAGPIIISDMKKIFNTNMNFHYLDKSLKNFNLIAEYEILINILNEYDGKSVLHRCTKNQVKVAQVDINSATDLIYQRLVPNEVMHIKKEKNIFKKINKIFKTISISKKNVSHTYSISPNNKYLVLYYFKKLFEMALIYIKTFLVDNNKVKSESMKIKEIDKVIYKL